MNNLAQNEGLLLGNTPIYGPFNNHAASSPSKPDLLISPDGVISAEPTDKEKHQLSILQRFIRQTASRRLLGKKRVSKCFRVRIAKTVKVYKSKAHGTCHLRDLAICGSVWDCPICSAKVSERRRIELSNATKQYKENYGGSILLVTFTYPHKKEDDLKQLFDKQQKASEWFYSHRTYKGPKGIRHRHNLDGRVKALEINHGNLNGWHPHVHELWFIESHLSDYEPLKLEVFDLWVKACEKYNLGIPSWKHGIDIRGGDDASGYVSKFGLETTKKDNWSVEHELTKANAKKGRNGSMTPFQLLDDYILGDEQSGSLFVEYSQVFHGKNQLSWTRGLKKMFNIDEITDEELAQMEDDQAEQLTEIDGVDWDRLVKKCNFSHDTRAIINFLGQSGGADAIHRYVNSFKTIKR